MILFHDYVHIGETPNAQRRLRPPSEKCGGGAPPAGVRGQLSPCREWSRGAGSRLPGAPRGLACVGVRRAPTRWRRYPSLHPDTAISPRPDCPRRGLSGPLQSAGTLKRDLSTGPRAGGRRGPERAPWAHAGRGPAPGTCWQPYPPHRPGKQGPVLLFTVCHHDSR